MDRKGIKISVLLELIDNSESLEDLKKKILDTVEKPSVTTVNHVSLTEPKAELSDFNKKLKQGLNWNPKENKK